jgi:anhydro-N-acetylmuramic acid kinase
MFSTDVGPGNTLIDAFIQENFNNKSFDKNGEVAASGNVNFTLLKSLKEHLFFEEGFSKTTGPELFSKDYVRQAQQKSSTENISIPDLIATLTRFSAEGIADAVKSCFSDNEKPVLYLSGGGMHNPVLFKMISELLPDYSMKNTDRLGILPDAKEAVLFAILANEAISGGNTRIGNSRQGIPDISMGKISFPD